MLAEELNYGRRKKMTKSKEEVMKAIPICLIGPGCEGCPYWDVSFKAECAKILTEDFIELF